MKFEFEQNEFTVWNLLEYLKGLYGCQINGNRFSSSILHRWIRLKKLPEAYGGNKIIHAVRYKELSNLLVLSVEGISRDEVTYLIGSLDNYEQTLNKKRKKDVLQTKNIPHKQRTKLYFETLDKAGKQYTKKRLAQSTLPLYWKEAGIKKNQLVNRSKNKS
jgi:hypothetical protein